MDTTVADTQKNKKVKLTKAQRRLKQHYLRHAKKIKKSRENYYKESTLLDCVLEETGVLHGFFSNLDNLSLISLEKINKAATYFMLHANCEIKVKEALSEELNNLQNFFMRLSNYRNLISERAFYYEELWDKLEEIKEREYTK